MSGGRGRGGWLTDLVLGVRLSVAGGRSGWLRLAMIAAGVGLGVAMLLLVAAAPTANAYREQRRADRALGPSVERAGADTLLALTTESRFKDVTVRGRIVRAEGDRAPAPPGVSRLPAESEMVISSALAELLAGPGGDVLRERWSARVIGTIAPPGLSGPRELYFYAGSDTLNLDDGAQRIDAFGTERDDSASDPVLIVLAVVGLVILLLPVLIFLTNAVRFGSEARERQLAAIRLVGADRRMTHRIAAGDSLVGAVLGLGLGALVFLAVRPVAGGLLPADFGPYASDLSPVPVLIALIAISVPAAAILVSVATLRRAVIEPLGVVRRGGTRRRRLWWRLIPPAAGLLLLYPLLDGLSGDIDSSARSQLAVGAALLLVGVVVLLPWLVQAVVQRLSGGGVAWQLAARRLQMDSDTAVRTVSGVAVSVAGIIAFHALLAASAAVDTAMQPPAERFQVAVYPNGADSTGWAEMFAGIEGVRQVRETGYASLQDDGGAGVRVGDCESLRQFAPLPSCSDGDIFATSLDGWYTTTPSPGTILSLGEIRWMVPAGLRTVPLYVSDAAPTTYLATPGAFKLDPSLRGTDIDAYLLVLDPADPYAVERLRNVMVQLAPAAPIQLFGDRQLADRFSDAARAAQAGAILLLLFIGASVLVTVVEQLRERRRLLAVLTAFGTSRRTLAVSVLHQTAIPTTIGLLLAMITGSALAAILLAVTDGPVDVDAAAVAGITAAAVAMVLTVTAASLPLLFRLTRAQELHSE